MSGSQTHVCPLVPLQPLPRWTADLPGCGGNIRVAVEDFEVEEIPLYLPAGAGDHLYLWIEKIDVAGETLRRHVARALDMSGGDVGMAGLKDRRAVTRQWLSVPRDREPRLGQIESDRVHVLDVQAHRNKLRTGHLAGNRFRIRIRGVVEDAAALLEAKLARIAQTGLPNFYGSQRMGHGGSTLAAGWALTQGMTRTVQVRTPDDVVHSLHLADRPLRRLAASAIQSEVFNRTLARRMELGILRQVLDGDVCKKTDTGGVFVTEDVAREQRRLEAGEIVVTGPMWGPKMTRALREAGELEAEVLRIFGMQPADFAALGHLAEGTRRPATVQPGEVGLEVDGDSAVVTFTLPAGSFATGLIHELVGPSAALAQTDFAEDEDSAAGNLAGGEVPCA